MAGINIPIRGDTRGLRGAIRELTAEIKGLSATLRAGLVPAKVAAQETAAAVLGGGMAATRRRLSVGGMVTGLIGAITAAAGLAGSLVMLGKEVPMLIRIGRTIVASVKEPLVQATRESQGFLAALGRFARTPAFKYLLAGAAAAAVGIGALLLGIRGGIGVLRMFGSVAGSVFGKVAALARGTASVVRGAFAGLKALVPSFGLGGGGMFGGVAGLVGIGGALALVVSQAKEAFEGAAGFEELQTRVESFTGSAAKAAGLLKELKLFADATQFSTKGVQEAAESLLGAGVTKDVAGITKDLAALAKSDQVLGELADALGKGFAKGKFQTEELNKFLERGINLIPQFTAVTGLAGKELTKAIEAGLQFDVVTQSIGRMSAAGGQFYGVLGRLGMTFRGLWSTFTSGLADIRKAFAMPILMALKPMLQEATKLTAGWAETARKAGEAVADALRVAFALVKTGQGGAVLRKGVELAFRSGVDVLMRGLRSAVAFLYAALPAAFEVGTSMIRDPQFWGGVVDTLSGIGKIFAAEIRGALPGADEEGLGLLRELGRRSLEAGRLGIGNAWLRGNQGEDLGRALQEAQAAASKAFSGMAKSPELRALEEEFKRMVESVGSEVEKLRKGSVVPGPEKGATGAGIGTRSDNFIGGLGSAVKEAVVLATSMARIGGGGFGMVISPMVSEQKKGNRLLEKIAKNTEKMGGGVAVYA